MVAKSASFFPYEHLTSFETLQETSLPPYKSFFSSLKNQTVMENEINSFFRNGGSLDDPNRPKTGLEVYEDIKQTWEKEGFQTMMDYLHYYNNLDVYPLHKAVNKMAQFYEQHPIDLLKETLTLSGAANKILHRSNKGEGFFLFNYKNEELYQSVRNNIVAGPSLVFSRYKKNNETAINDEKVKSIVGYDANAFYLSTIGGNMPTGPLTHYVCNSDNTLVSEKSKFLQAERQYVAFISKHHHDQNPNCSETTRFTNMRHQVRTLVPHANCVSCKIVYEFLGRYHHTHDCMSLVT